MNAKIEERPKEIDNLLDFVSNEIRKESLSQIEIEIDRKRKEIEMLRKSTEEK